MLLSKKSGESKPPAVGAPCLVDKLSLRPNSREVGEQKGIEKKKNEHKRIGTIQCFKERQFFKNRTPSFPLQLKP